jgi:polyribonucleotide nucleotidyltransferase
LRFCKEKAKNKKRSLISCLINNRDARVCHNNKEFIFNPSLAAAKESDLDLVVSDTNGNVLMIESKT